MFIFCVKETDWGMMAFVAYFASWFSEEYHVFRHVPSPPPCPSPPLVLPQGGVGHRHLVNPKRAKPPPKGAVQSTPVESGEHVQEFKVKWSRTKKFYTERVKE